MLINEDSIIASQTFNSPLPGYMECTVELWIQWIGEQECEYAVRTNHVYNRSIRGKFTHSESSSVSAFNSKKRAVADYNSELAAYGDPQLDAHRITY